MHVLDVTTVGSSMLRLSVSVGRGSLDHAWQAHGIGPGAMAALTFSDASWIWSNEPGIDPTRKAPAGNRSAWHRCGEVGRCAFGRRQPLSVTCQWQEIGRG